MFVKSNKVHFTSSLAEFATQLNEFVNFMRLTPAQRINVFLSLEGDQWVSMYSESEKAQWRIDFAYLDYILLYSPANYLDGHR